MAHIRNLGIVIGMIALLLSAHGTSAHARFVRADPAPGSVLTTAPARVTIEFSDDLARGTWITVVGPAGTVVSTGETTRDGKEARVALQAAGTGVYTVNWKSISADDGDEDSDSFQFGVGAAGTVSPRTGGLGSAVETQGGGHGAELRAKLSGPTRVALGDAATFDASDSEGEIVRFSWNFGDGSFATGGPTVSHVFQQPGTYTVTVDITDGKTDAVATLTVTVVDMDMSIGNGNSGG
jgi:methionine-rich copper-binding protein CopC